MKFILVSGGVMSGIGKGVITSSIGSLLKSCMIPVTAIKIDPYINVDAGTFSPYEHGEVFVLDDGTEVDLDLGNYERFMGVRLKSENNITTGKILLKVINDEREGKYLGKTVQYVPHLTDAIKDWIMKVSLNSVEDPPLESHGKSPQVCIIELGGTVGDIENMVFIEACRQMRLNLGKENFCSIHVSLVPESMGEQKTKPTQATFKELMRLGIMPDLLLCRSRKPLETEVRAKIASFCNMKPCQVISIPDVTSIYMIPLILEGQNVINILRDFLQIDNTQPADLTSWKSLINLSENLVGDVKIALVGKYTKIADSYVSVMKALNHSAIFCRRKLIVEYIEASNLQEEMKSENNEKYSTSWQKLKEADGIVVPGGFGDRGISGKIAAIEYARVNKKPFLGLCLGMQCAVIECARNLLGWKDANSAEIECTNTPVIIHMPECSKEVMGGTMRLGARTTLFTSNTSIIRRLYKNVDKIIERHRHRYEVNPDYIKNLDAVGLKFVGTDESGKRMEILELVEHPYFVGTQFHPEYLSKPFKPSPPFLGLILACINALDEYLARGTLLNGI